MENEGYEIWLLGYNDDQTVNDFEQLIATFPDEETAKWFMENYEFNICPTNHIKAVLEHVIYDPEFGGSCVAVLMETEL